MPERPYLGYAQNASRTADWRAQVLLGRPATARGHALTAEDRLRGAAIKQLFCYLAVDPDGFENRGAVRAMTWTIASHGAAP